MFSKDQHHWIEETSAHILSHWSAIVVKDHQQLVNPGCQGWWLAVQKSTIPWSWTILEIMPPRNRLKTTNTQLPSCNKWTQRKPFISATTGSNLEDQRVVICKVMQAYTKIYGTNGCIYTPIAPKLLMIAIYARPLQFSRGMGSMDFCAR